MGNLLSKTDRKSQKTVTQYDGINRPHIVTYQDGSTITITWDAGNRPTTFADTTNGTISRQYDQLDRLTQETGPQGTVNYTQYDAAGRLIQMSVVGQANAIVYGYDNANRLRSITQGSNVVSLTPDSANRPGTVTLPNGIVGTYTFDNANELTGLSYALGSTTVGNLGYSYDAAGRRISATGSLAGYTPPSAITMAFDASNRMTAYGGTVPAYDLNGSMIGFGNTSYTWNARNQLVATSAGSSTFAYDAFGRRVASTIAGASTSYLYSGMNAVVAGGAQMLDGFGLDEIYASTTSGATSSYLMDGINSTAALTSGSGAVTNSYTYSPYGDSAGGGATPFQFTGRENDGATGLYYYRSRYYLPQTDRFISQDPIQVAAGTNFYAYAGGNPIDNRDPLGLWTGQVGISVGIQLGPISWNSSIGLAFDGYGNVSVYGEAGPGVGGGADVSAGLVLHGSNAKTICDLNGPFANVSAGGGWGAHATGDAFYGHAGDGSRIEGGGITLGVGAGAQSSASITGTSVLPPMHLW